MTPLIQKLRSAGEAERTLAPASKLFDEAADEIERLTDRTDGLNTDLFDAVQTAFNRGAGALILRACQNSRGSGGNE